MMAAPLGIEPRSSALETGTLTTVLWGSMHSEECRRGELLFALHESRNMFAKAITISLYLFISL